MEASEIAAFPLPNAWAPSNIKWSPDDSLLTFLQSTSGTLRKSLHSMPTSEGVGAVTCILGAKANTKELTREEQLRRQRARERSIGVTKYAWIDGARPGALVPYDGDVVFKPQSDLGATIPVITDGVAVSPIASPTGDKVAFVRDNELYVTAIPSSAQDAKEGDKVKLTSGATEDGNITNGLADYIAQEELDRAEGFWWSPDGTQIAYAQVDSRHLPSYRIMHQGKQEVGPSAEEDHQYPFAGMPNAYVKLGVVSADGSGDTQWLDLGPDPDIYLARVAWMPDNRLVAQVLNRAQTRVDLVTFDLQTGARSVLVSHESKVWINIRNDFTPLKDGSGDFVWTCEESGFNHIYVYASDGKLKRQVTEGAWQVDEIVSVDHQKRNVYFCGTKDSPLERHLYVVNLDASDAQVKRLTLGPGTHRVVLNHNHTMFIDLHNALDRPPWVTLRSSITGSLIGTLHDMPPAQQVADLNLKPPQLITIPAEDGTLLHGALYIPDGDGPFPTVVSVYGGPHAQRVTHSWSMTVSMRAQFYRSQGLLVFVLDNRGSSRRGLAFEGALKWNMGSVEVADQVTGVKALIEKKLTDPERVGVYGWSYGGYMSILLLSEPLFRVAVSGAPVTHWDGYDTCYTERYMGTPQENPEGYERSSCMARVDSMNGKLLLVHGLIDENVHFRHTARYINSLIGANKRYDLLLFPNERHMPVRPGDRTYLEQRMAEYLCAELLRP